MAEIDFDDLEFPEYFDLQYAGRLLGRQLHDTKVRAALRELLATIDRAPPTTPDSATRTLAALHALLEPGETDDAGDEAALGSALMWGDARTDFLGGVEQGLREWADERAAVERRARRKR